ncbi:MAG: hypothetical protein E6H91_10840 [Chloroflexi bacterium]|nr:MAG: hypothetical protein E6H91_10840 [Chloroflexota bacterium]
MLPCTCNGESAPGAGVAVGAGVGVGTLVGAGVGTGVGATVGTGVGAADVTVNVPAGSDSVYSVVQPSEYTPMATLYVPVAPVRGTAHVEV